MNRNGERWQDIYMADKDCMIEIMKNNMQCDLAAGYDPHGKSITEQRQMIAEYCAQYDRELEALDNMTEQQAERWCYYNLKRRGAI